MRWRERLKFTWPCENTDISAAHWSIDALAPSLLAVLTATADLRCTSEHRESRLASSHLSRPWPSSPKPSPTDRGHFRAWRQWRLAPTWTTATPTAALKRRSCSCKPTHLGLIKASGPVAAFFVKSTIPQLPEPAHVPALRATRCKSYPWSSQEAQKKL